MKLSIRKLLYLIIALGLIVFCCNRIKQDIESYSETPSSEITMDQMILNSGISFSTSSSAFTSIDADPYIVFGLDNTYIDTIRLVITSSSDDWQLSTYYTDTTIEEHFDVITSIITKKNATVDIKLNATVSQLRFDFSEEAGNGFYINSITVNPSHRILNNLKSIAYYILPIIFCVMFIASLGLKPAKVRNDATKHIREYDFIRAMATLIIVAYHFSTMSVENSDIWGEFRLFYHFRSGDWGEVAVVLFFILSGALLYLRYPVVEPLELLKFYKRRLLILLPPFWLVWGYLYIQRSIQYKDWFFAGSFSKMILSFIGMDGYFYYLSPNYYVIGEWYLGAIIFCYLIYPGLAYILKYRSGELFGTLGLAAMLPVVGYMGIFKIAPMANLFTCLFLMWMGMIFTKHRNIIYPNRILSLVSLVVVIALYDKSYFANNFIPAIVFSLFLFILLWNIAGMVMESSKLVNKCVMFVSGVSYAVFLIHHTFIRTMNQSWHREPLTVFQQSLIFIYYLILILIFADLLMYLTKKIRSAIGSTYHKKQFHS